MSIFYCFLSQMSIFGYRFIKRLSIWKIGEKYHPSLCFGMQARRIFHFQEKQKNVPFPCGKERSYFCDVTKAAKNTEKEGVEDYSVCAGFAEAAG